MNGTFLKLFDIEYCSILKCLSKLCSEPEDSLPKCNYFIWTQRKSHFIVWFLWQPPKIRKQTFVSIQSSLNSQITYPTNIYLFFLENIEMFSFVLNYTKLVRFFFQITLEVINVEDSDVESICINISIFDSISIIKEFVW